MKRMNNPQSTIIIYFDILFNILLSIFSFNYCFFLLSVEDVSEVSLSETKTQ